MSLAVLSTSARTSLKLQSVQSALYLLLVIALLLLAFPTVGAGNVQPLVRVNNEFANTSTRVGLHGYKISITCPHGDLDRDDEEHHPVFVLNETTQGRYHCRHSTNRSSEVTLAGEFT